MVHPGPTDPRHMDRRTVDYVDLTFRCPADHVAEGYAMWASWLTKLNTRAEAEKEASPRTDRWWNDLSPLAKDVFTLFALSPDHKFAADDIATMLSVPHGRSGVAGVFAWPGRHAKKYELPYPWGWETDALTGITYYWMDSTLAQVFATNAAEHAQTDRWQKKMG